MTNRFAENGDTVTIHYSGFDNDGENVDSTLETGPVTIILGAGNVIRGIEHAILGMQSGGEKTILVEPKDGFTDPQHPLFGKEIIYEIKLVKIE